MTDSEKLDLILSKVNSFEVKMNNFESKMDTFESKMNGFESKVDTLDSKMDTLETSTQELKQRTANIEKDVTDIKFILENEIRINIQRVAEGHLDLSRNLHDAMKPSNEIEMLAIKVRMLESDMREVKAKLA